MIKIYTIALILLSCLGAALAQAPQGINYQAVARDANGHELINTAVVFRFIIHDTIATGPDVFTETDTITTNQFGLATVQIGAKGSPPFTALAAVNWSSGNKYLQVGLVAQDGSTTDMGTTQLLSVPYALSAANGLPPGDTAGQMLYWNGSAWVKVAPGPNYSLLSFYNGAPVWVPSQYYVGQHYGGGIIFYMDNTNQHGLIAATSDQSTGANWDNGSYILCNASGTALLTGAANTDSIIKYQGVATYAASVARNYNGGGYNDWYLPSIDELSLLYQNQNIVGGFDNTHFYWSSSEYDTFDAWYIDFEGDVTDTGDKYGYYNVRAIRAF